MNLNIYFLLDNNFNDRNLKDFNSASNGIYNLRDSEENRGFGGAFSGMKFDTSNQVKILLSSYL